MNCQVCKKDLLSIGGFIILKSKLHLCSGCYVRGGWKNYMDTVYGGSEVTLINFQEGKPLKKSLKPACIRKIHYIGDL